MESLLISHIYNEEYLLPFWLEHHKPMFDKLIIIDYNSTDRSIEICKNIWPECIIIKSRNKEFDAKKVDQEVMYIESNFIGTNIVKMVLNTTEFLFSHTDIKNLFHPSVSIAFSVKCYSPYSKNNYEFNSKNELYLQLLKDDIKYNDKRGFRIIHNHTNGNYKLGRHQTNYYSVNNNLLYILWLGFFPMNENVMKRKLQIKNKMSEHDKNNNKGFQHLYDREKIIQINNKYAEDGKVLIDLNKELYNLIKVYNEK